MEGEQGALRFDSVCRFFDLPQTTMLGVMARPDFPKPIQLTERSKVWRRADLMDWLRRQIITGNPVPPRAKDDDETDPEMDDEPSSRVRRRGVRAKRVTKGGR